MPSTTGSRWSTPRSHHRLVQSTQANCSWISSSRGVSHDAGVACVMRRPSRSRGATPWVPSHTRA